MKPQFALLVGVLLLAARAAADDDVAQPESGEAFKKLIADNNFVLAAFTAPWCGHCKALKPEFSKAAAALKSSGSTVKLSNVDCTAADNKDLCQSYDVQGYPTIKWFSKSKATDYEGGRTEKDIIDFAVKFSGPAVTQLESEEKLKIFTTSSSLNAVAFLDTKDTKSLKLVEELAEELRSSVRFGVYTKGVILPAKKAPAIVLYRDFDPEPILFDGSMVLSDIKAFFKKESFPLVTEISPSNYRAYLAREIPMVWVFLGEEGTEKTIAEIKVAAKAMKGLMSVVHLSGAEYKRHAENMGLNTEKFPGIVVDDFTNKKKYLYSQDKALESKALSEWLLEVSKGQVKPHVKSEPIPEKNDSPVTVVVGKNFKKIVMDVKKDVLLELYAPWCGHCQSLEPKYNKLGEHFEKIESIVIAKVDATANDVPIDVQGFPTIKFFPANKKSEPIEYSGARTMVAMAKFVLEQSTTLTAAQKTDLAPPDDGVTEEEEPEEEAGEREEL